MSNRYNYQNFYNNPKKEEPIVEEVKEAPVVEETIEEPVVEEVKEEPIVEKVPVSTSKKYVVSGTPKLNVRTLDTTDSKVIKVLDSGEEVVLAEIQKNESDWYAITSPVHGHVMKKYIKEV